MGKFRELIDIFKTFGIRGVKNNLEYELEKTDREIEMRKQVLRDMKSKIKELKKNT